MSFLSYSQETTSSPIDHISLNSITSDDNNEDEFIDDDEDDDDSNEQSNESVDKSTQKKKTLGRVKIKMAYIDNKIRRYTTFSKRKTGIMKKAYELATLTGTEVMLLVASETGHVYTYATPKLQPMITSETGKALIQTCLAKDEPIIEQNSVSTTTLNNNDVILIDENSRKKRTHCSDDHTNPSRSIKHPKLTSSNEIKQSNPPKSLLSTVYRPPPPPPTTVAVPLSCLINSNSHDPSSLDTNSYTIDLNTLKTNGMNIVLTPPFSHSSSSDSPLVLTLGHFPHQPS